MIKILSLSGNKGAGKDEICKMIQKDFKNVIRLAFADDLKEEVSKEFGIPLDDLHKSEEFKNETLTGIFYNDLMFYYHSGPNPYDPDDPQGSDFPDDRQLTIRELLQIYGTEIMRDLDADYWCHKMQRKIYQISHDATSTTLIVVTDARFPNEIDMLSSYGKSSSIWLNRNSTGSTDSHISEQDLSELCEYQVDARGLTQFSYTYSEVVDIIDCELNIQRIKY